MNGLTLSKAYYETYGAPMLASDFPALLPHLAAGLIGSGSECFGYDDEISTDHDFEPGFILFRTLPIVPMSCSKPFAERNSGWVGIITLSAAQRAFNVSIPRDGIQSIRIKSY